MPLGALGAPGDRRVVTTPPIEPAGEDAFAVETAIGRVDVVFAYNRWVSASVRSGSRELRRESRQCASRSELSALLATVGLADSDPDSLARELWRRRPRRIRAA